MNSEAALFRLETRGRSLLLNRCLFKNKRGLDTIMASLLMVVIVVVASVMVFTYSTGLLGALLIAPKTATEALNVDYTTFPSGTAMSMFVRNTGSTPITLTAYYVKDSTGNEYARSNWVSPTFSPTKLANSTGGLSILINSACNSCALTGTAFTYQSGNAYTITLITNRNGQFTFSIVR